MEKVEFRCTLCGKTFVCEVVDPREAQQKRLATSPVRCPECKSTVLVRLRPLRTAG